MKLTKHKFNFNFPFLMKKHFTLHDIDWAVLRTLLHIKDKPKYRRVAS